MRYQSTNIDSHTEGLDEGSKNTVDEQIKMITGMLRLSIKESICV